MRSIHAKCGHQSFSRGKPDQAKYLVLLKKKNRNSIYCLNGSFNVFTKII